MREQGNEEVAAAAINARVIPSVAYTDPEVARVGLTEDPAMAQDIKVKKGLFPWTASGGAIANGRGKTIHPPPTLGEGIGMAVEHGRCTGLPPARA